MFVKVCVCVCVQGGSADGVCCVAAGDDNVSSSVAVGQQRHDSLPLSVRWILLRSGTMSSSQPQQSLRTPDPNDDDDRVCVCVSGAVYFLLPCGVQ